MEKRNKDSSVVQQNGIFGFAARILNDVKLFCFPPKMVFYVNDGADAVRPGMSRRQILRVSRLICSAAVKGAGGISG